MHVTASLAGQGTEVEVGEDCRSLAELKAAVATALRIELPVGGFDLAVGGCAADEDTALGLEDGTDLEVVLNTRGAALAALHERGLEVSGTMLCDCVHYGGVVQCELLLDAGVRPDSTGSRWPGAPALHVATMLNRRHFRDNYALCELLLDRGHPVESLYDNCTPLHMALREGYVDVCELLVERGHSVQCTNARTQTTPLHLLGLHGHRYLPRRHRTYGALCAITHLCWLFLKQGAKPQCVDVQQRTPLHFAAWGGEKFAGMCEMLLDHGHELQCVDNEGRTPLHWAAALGSASVCRILLYRGHDPHCVDNNGNTPLHYAEGSPFKLVLGEPVHRHSPPRCSELIREMLLDEPPLGSRLHRKSVEQPKSETLAAIMWRERQSAVGAEGAKPVVEQPKFESRCPDAA